MAVWLAATLVAEGAASDSLSRRLAIQAYASRQATATTAPQHVVVWEQLMDLAKAVNLDNKPLKPMQEVPLKRADHRFLVDTAEDFARRAANNPEPAVFCAPLAIFNGPNGWQARAEDLFGGPVISVDCDQHPDEALQKLEDILGEATAVVRSGGQWVNGDGRPEDKLHLYWRLKVLATGDNLRDLKQAFWLATALVGGDPSNATVVHGLRWPGSWHCKGQPRLCEFVRYNADREIELDAALAALRAADPELAAQAQAQAHRSAGNGEPQAPDDRIAAAVAVIPNTSATDWDTWNRIGMATFRATDGSQAGLEAFDNWSKKSPKYDAANTAARWAAYFKSQPDSIGAGTLFHLADQASKTWRLDYAAKVDPPPPEPPAAEPGPDRDEPAAGCDSPSSSAEPKAPALFDPWQEFIVPEFPLDVLPSVVRDFVDDCSLTMGVDRSAMGPSPR